MYKFETCEICMKCAKYETCAICMKCAKYETCAICMKCAKYETCAICMKYARYEICVICMKCAKYETCANSICTGFIFCNISCNCYSKTELSQVLTANLFLDVCCHSWKCMCIFFSSDIWFFFRHMYLAILQQISNIGM